MRDAIYALVSGAKAEPAIAARLADAGAIFTAAVPQGQARSYLVLHGLADPGYQALEGVRLSIGSPNLQVEAWGNTAEDALDLAQAVENWLDGFSGTLGVAPYGVACLGAFKRDKRGPIAADLSEGSEDRAFVVHLDFELWLRRT